MTMMTMMTMTIKTTMMTTSKRERKEREKNREINAVREREKKKCCGNYGIQLGIRLMVC